MRSCAVTAAATYEPPRTPRGPGAASLLQGLGATFPGSISGAEHKAQEMGADPELCGVFRGVLCPLPEG